MDIRDHGGPFGGGKYRKGKDINYKELQYMDSAPSFRTAQIINASNAPTNEKFVQQSNGNLSFMYFYSPSNSYRCVELTGQGDIIQDFGATPNLTNGYPFFSSYLGRHIFMISNSVRVYNEERTALISLITTYGSTAECLYAYEVGKYLVLLIAVTSSLFTVTVDLETLTVYHPATQIGFTSNVGLSSVFDGRAYFKMGGSSGPVQSIDLFSIRPTLLSHTVSYNGSVVSVGQGKAVTNSGTNIEVWDTTATAWVKIATRSVGSSTGVLYARPEKDEAWYHNSGSMKKMKLSDWSLIYTTDIAPYGGSAVRFSNDENVRAVFHTMTSSPTAIYIHVLTEGVRLK